MTRLRSASRWVACSMLFTILVLWLAGTALAATSSSITDLPPGLEPERIKPGGEGFSAFLNRLLRVAWYVAIFLLVIMGIYQITMMAIAKDPHVRAERVVGVVYWGLGFLFVLGLPWIVPKLAELAGGWG